jgi:hypothetical protein
MALRCRVSHSLEAGAIQLAIGRGDGRLGHGSSGWRAMRF